MKNIFNFLIVITLFISLNSARATNPLYRLEVSNFQTTTTSSGCFNTVFFDFVIQHTNLLSSGPFEFASGNYLLYFNPLIANGGTLSYTIVSNSTQFSDTNAIPTNPQIIGNKLVLNPNVNLGGTGPIVSPIFPGTRIVRMKLATTAACFDEQYLNFSWLAPGGGDIQTAIYAYINGVSTNVSGGGTLLIDSSQNALPVELSTFTSDIAKNNVILNWTTSSETNNSGFEIERSDVNRIWNKIGFTQGYGSTSAPNNYSFEDKNLNSGNYYYRLKQIDYNGNFEYFNLTGEVTIGVPNTFSLEQNYPNPFNPTTKIDYAISVNGIVSLKIFDINGRELKTLINEIKDPGYYTVDLDASSLPSGVYYYRLESGNFTSTKKLVVLK